MKKPIIAVDVDDVLASFNEGIRHFVNEHYGLNLTAEDYNVKGSYWGFWEQIWGVSHEEGDRRVDAYLTSGSISEMGLIPHAIEVIKELEKTYELYVVTARNTEYAEQTHEWLTKHFPEVFKDVHFLAIWDEKSPKETKAAICKKIGAKYLIDDNIEHCTLAAEAGVTALLFGDYGWNRELDKVPENVVRCKDWLAVQEFLTSGV